jgi:hypothetical protein
MAWETRGEHGPYYTRSRRVNGRVVREYVGSGEVAEIVALADETMRLQARAKAEQEREALERARETAAAGGDVDEAAEILARAEMVAAGWHRHKGEWRRRRDA